MNLRARLLILLPSAAAAFQFIASKIPDTGTAARNSLMNSNILMPSPITSGDILLMVLIPASRCFSCCWLYKRHTAQRRTESGALWHQLIRRSSRLIVMSKLLRSMLWHSWQSGF